MTQTESKPIQPKPGYPHDIVDPYHVVSWLFELHYQRQIIPPRPFNTYLRECKQMMKEIPLPEMIDILSTINTERPFGFKLVKEVWQKTRKRKI